MTPHRCRTKVSCAAMAVAVTATGCSFTGLNSLPLPGAVGRGPDSQTFVVQLANVGTLEPNSPVMIDNVVVGSIRTMNARDWHAVVDVSVQKDVVVPANAVATVGQTSLLGSMHLALDPPPGEPPRGRLRAGTTIEVNNSSAYPSTEETLSTLSILVNGGGLGQIGDVIHNTGAALSGRTDETRQLLSRLNDVAGVLATNRTHIVDSIRSLDRLAGTFAAQRDVLDRALKEIPPALDVLVQQRSNITEALRTLGTFSGVLNGVVTDVHNDLITNLENLEPVLRVLADVGPDLDAVLAYMTTYPLSQDIIDRGVRGDYMNLFAVIDLTVARLRRTTLLGTRFGVPQYPLVPAPGDPWYRNYSYDPLAVPVAPATPAPNETAAASPSPEMFAEGGPSMAVNPPPLLPPAQLGGPEVPIFAGPYGVQPPSTEGGR
ncbi:MCE family protein [Mycolicibacterium sp. OfavD-34-C]|uniref:MCE family protein n=1 Tax=Mycolicibacterium sp. OfavD-34-C TaxID=2917746 RepID=UPI0035ABFBFD